MAKVKLEFGNDFSGCLTAEQGTFKLGDTDQGLYPYEMFLAALGSCFYATFLDIAEKMKLEYTYVEFNIEGKHREEVPTTLETVTIQFVINGANKEQEDKFRRASELAGKYCSIHETIAKVAQINVDLQLN